MSSTSKGCLQSLAGLLVVGLVLLIVIGAITESPSDRPSQTPLTTPTEVSIPPPIATEPCPTAAEQAYLLALSKHLIGIGNASTELQRSLQHPGLPADLEARRVVVIWSAGILLVAEKILLLDHPTARLSEVDQAASRLAESWKAGLALVSHFPK